VKLRRLWAVARKEFLHVLRDARSLGLAIALPVILLVLFGYALTLDVDHIPLAVWDQSRTAASRELLSRFCGSRYFAVRRSCRSYRELERAIDAGDALMALVIPSDFAARVASGRRTAVQAIVDGADPNTATIAMSYATAIVRDYSQELVLAEVRRAGLSPPPPAIDPRPRVWFNPEMESKNFIIPGLIAIIMMVIAALLTSQTVAREWERGTMEQLISTPVRPAEVVLGKLIPYFAIGMLDVALAVLMGGLLFAVPLGGSLALLFLASAVFLAGALGMGLVISIVAPSQLLANELAMVLTYLPAFLLSGFMFPIANMPKVIQAVTYAIPARYFMVILRGIYLKGLGLAVLGPELLLLAGFALAVGTIAILKFRKTMR